MPRIRFRPFRDRFCLPADTVYLDGNTFDVTVNGVPDTVRMYQHQINAPEVSDNLQGGGLEVTDHLGNVTQHASGSMVYLE